jgi:hypothetical protein
VLEPDPGTVPAEVGSPPAANSEWEATAMSATTEIPVVSRTTEMPALCRTSELPVVSPTTAPEDTGQARNRSFVLTWLLSLLLGFLGLDRFYTGRYLTGVLKLLSLGGLGIWWIVDLVIVLAGGLRCQRRPLRGFETDREIAWIATGLTIIIAYSMQLDEVIVRLLNSIV